MRLAVALSIMTLARTLALSKLPAPSQLRVAVAGAGVSGALAARRLAEAGARVTVFEAGRGPGGRMASRRAEIEGRAVYFDHGATYFSPKGEQLAALVDEWVSAGAAAQWRGRFGALTWQPGGGAEFALDAEAKPRFVGTPQMNAIARHLLAHERIEAVFSTRIKSAALGDGGAWTLGDASGATLGDGAYDVLLSSDRLMGAKPPTTAADTLLDARDGDGDGAALALPRFAAAAAAVESSRSLVLMLGFAGDAAEAMRAVPLDAALVTPPADGIDAPAVISYVSRDSSKPGRAGVDDGGGAPLELWVAHATPAFAAAALDAQNAAVAAGADGADALRRDAEPALVAGFEALLARWLPGGALPPRAYASVHRWGAAFPSVPVEADGVPAIAELEGRFAAVGDYLSSPRVEGAVVSAEAGAKLVLDACAPDPELPPKRTWGKWQDDMVTGGF